MLSETKPVAIKRHPGQYTQAEKKTYVAKWKQSQLTRSEFCRREGLCLQTFCYWIKAPPAQPNKQLQPALSFVPVGTKNGMVDINPGFPIEIHLPNGLHCCFKSQIEVQTLLKIVEGLSDVTDD